MRMSWNLHNFQRFPAIFPAVKMQHVSKVLFHPKILLFLPAARPHCHTSQFWGKHPCEANQSSEQGWEQGTANIWTAQTQVSFFFKSRPVLTFERLQLIKEERRNSEQYSSFSSPNSSFPHCMIPPALQGGKHLSEKQQQQQTNKPGFKNIPES